MIYKGVVSATTEGGKRVSVTTHAGGIVTSWLVVPFYLIGLLPVGTTVIYATFADNTGIVIHREDGIGNVTDVGTDDLGISATVKNGVLVVSANGDDRVSAFVENDVLVIRQSDGYGLSARVENDVLVVSK